MLHNSSCAHCSEGVVAMSYDSPYSTETERQNRIEIAFLKLAAISEILVVCGLFVLAVLLILK